MEVIGSLFFHFTSWRCFSRLESVFVFFLFILFPHNFFQFSLYAVVPWHIIFNLTHTLCGCHGAEDN